MIHTTPAQPNHGKAPHRIALLFNANKIYDRQVITGIGEYLGSTRVAWDLFLEEDFRCRLNGLENWQGDGIIADFDDPAVAEALAKSPLPVVAVGSSYQNEADYPRGVPYVATDNLKLIKLAHDHLIDVGLERFALYSLPESSINRWAQEREKAFSKLVGKEAEIHRGLATSPTGWSSASEQLAAWLKSLPKPVGVIAVTDARARHLLQACLSAGIAVPEEVSIIGIDNDPLTRTLNRIPLSSVAQGAEEMGRTAAHMLHQMLHGARLGETRILVPPVGINVLASSQYQPLSSPYVMRARHYIRQYACQGIKTEQVADYVGVSRSSLESYFRRELGYTVHQEILLFKLEKAREMLLAGELPTSEIAVRCGFTSLQYLHAVFKRELGCTPREFYDRSVDARGAPPVLIQ
ncbi:MULTISPECIES: XylR family transcriptional regulator [Silvimonas]|uniref:XylR family transcriptional regulator n=1 Tax=Silvimonas TaxID=300264 RepID=UPI0024B38A1D|nr:MULTISPECIES: DNA-binding transcriptional regulator [Silvimonas]MDR3429909.1 DNA-binding transcriptional regulator [Silvimonas sp.]